jgi:superfamily II DNA or RNA helicase
VTKIQLPAQFEIRLPINRNPVFRLRRPAWKGEAEVSGYSQGRSRGLLAVRPDGSRTIVVTTHAVEPILATDTVLLAKDVEVIRQVSAPGALERTTKWLTPAPLPADTLTSGVLRAKCAEARQSWVNAVRFREEQIDGPGLIQTGLRRAQVGALHAALAHWSVTDSSATIVMPTGIGKTEVMLTLLAATQPSCLLVIVPTDTLRDQIGGKFVSFGLLHALGVLAPTAQFPVVGLLQHAPRVMADVDRLFGACNVVVATAAIAARCSDAVQRRIAHHVTHLFIDEAHHVAAATWDAFKRQLEDRPVLQFTATPFRRDRRPVAGHAIYAYPLRLAQRDGYFKPIRFAPVTEFSPARADRVIAVRATSQLRDDLAGGFDHVLLARVDSIRRAEEVLGVYAELSPEYAPVAIHTRMPRRERRLALDRLLNRSSRIIVCVDMLGEGFDLPNLKVAALHDTHASLAVTLQFVGRFTREAAGQVGQPTFVANIADPDVEHAILELYAEDADWNDLLQHLSEGATRRYREQSALLNGFSDVPLGFPLYSIQPKMSTIVYRTSCPNWSPDELLAPQEKGAERMWLAVNRQERVALLLLKEESPARWTAGSEPKDRMWLLYIAYWAKDLQLLFINCSTEVALPHWIADTLTGLRAELISGEAVFRGLHGIHRLTLMNLGLKHALNRGARFTMYAGADVLAGLEQSRLANSVKTNLFGLGYEAGGRASLGCSLKGRLWSYKVAGDISEWIAWCRRVGPKLGDDTISPRAALEHVLIPEVIQARPDLVPLAVEWPDEILLSNQDVLMIEIGARKAPLLECDIQLLEPARVGPLRFRITVADTHADYEVFFEPDGVRYQPLAAAAATLIRSGRRIDLGEWLAGEPPIFRFEDNAFLDGNRLFRIRNEHRVPFDRNRIVPWDWSGTNIRRESQGPERDPTSIQHAVIQALRDRRLGGPFDMIMDDDGPGEVADVVAARSTGDDVLELHFLHCKYSSDNRPGARIDDLYAVCGQAVKSVPWKGRIEKMCRLLGKRQAAREARTGVSGFEVGDRSALVALRRRARYLNVTLTITVVQPGLSAAQASEAQLDLLAATASYVKETYAADLRVIGSV